MEQQLVEEMTLAARMTNIQLRAKREQRPAVAPEVAKQMKDS